jgi:flagellar protein FlbD
VIQLTSLRREALSLNPALIERIQELPNTTIVLVDGTRVIVLEPMAEVNLKVTQYHAVVLAEAWVRLGRGDAPEQTERS